MEFFRHLCYKFRTLDFGGFYTVAHLPVTMVSPWNIELRALPFDRNLNFALFSGSFVRSYVRTCPSSSLDSDILRFPFCVITLDNRNIRFSIIVENVTRCAYNVIINVPENEALNATTER